MRRTGTCRWLPECLRVRFIKERNEVFLRKWSQELKHTEQIYEQISRSAKHENHEKLAELKERISLLKEVIGHA